MSSLLAFFNDHTIGVALRLLVVAVAALLANRLLRALSNGLIRPAAGASRAEQARELQTRALAGLAYKAGSAAIWLVAALMALALLGINPAPALVVAAVLGIAAGFGAKDTVRDVIAGFHIVLEDQYIAGETVEIAGASGRVEQLTLRRTVLRDARGALVTIANGEIRAVANLSRDWSQSLLDISLDPGIPLEKPLSALEQVAAELRADAAWSQALVDGPRVLGVQGYGRDASVVRLQVRTLPMRQEEISRELRRRIQLEFQKRGIAPAGVARFETPDPQTAAELPSSLSSR